MRNRTSGNTRPTISIPIPTLNTTVVLVFLLIIGILAGGSGYFVGTTTFECAECEDCEDIVEPDDVSQYYYDQLKNYWVYLFPFNDNDVVTVNGGTSGGNVIMDILHTVPNADFDKEFRFVMQSDGIIKDVQVIG